jgi:hypothetical protein
METSSFVILSADIAIEVSSAAGQRPVIACVMCRHFFYKIKKMSKNCEKLCKFDFRSG